MANLPGRLDVPLVNPDETDHRRQLAIRANASLPKDGTLGATAPVLLRSYTVAGLPDATMWQGGLIYVSNESGGPVVAFSDGTNWRRCTDRVIVS